VAECDPECRDAGDEVVRGCVEVLPVCGVVVVYVRGRFRYLRPCGKPATTCRPDGTLVCEEHAVFNEEEN